MFFYTVANFRLLEVAEARKPAFVNQLGLRLEEQRAVSPVCSCERLPCPSRAGSSELTVYCAFDHALPPGTPTRISSIAQALEEGWPLHFSRCLKLPEDSVRKLQICFAISLAPACCKRSRPTRAQLHRHAAVMFRAHTDLSGSFLQPIRSASLYSKGSLLTNLFASATGPQPSSLPLFSS